MLTQHSPSFMALQLHPTPHQKAQHRGIRILVSTGVGSGGHRVGQRDSLETAATPEIPLKMVASL